jgi:plasmid maintenance system killer protein
VDVYVTNAYFYFRSETFVKAKVEVICQGENKCFAIRLGLRDVAALRGNRFEALRGDHKGQCSIRINDQWRICFEWPGATPGPLNVEIVDYH